MPVKSSAAGGQPAGKQSNVEQTLVSTPDSTTDNPLLGPYVLARLLAGLPVAEALLAQAGAPWQTIGLALLPYQDAERVQHFERLLEGQPQAADLRRAVFRVDPAQPLPEPAAPMIAGEDFPELPETALLPANWEDPQAGRFLKDYLNFACLAAPMSDLAFHLAVGLTLLAVAVARRVYLQIGILRLFTNLYQLIVAESTVHHKTTALSVGEALLKAAGLNILLLASRQTPESLVAELGTQRPPTFDSWGTAEKQRWVEERRYSAQRGWFTDEASHLLDSFNRDYTAGLLPLTLRLYDCPERDVAQTVGRGRQAVHNAYLTILGATTPSALGEHLTRNANWSNGLWARFCLVTPQSSIPEWHFFPQGVEIPADLAQRLNALAFGVLPAPQIKELAGEVQVEPPPAILVELTPEVRQAWENYAKALGYDLLLGGNVERRLWPSYGRLYISAMKVAILLAVSDWAALPEAERPKTPTVLPGHWFMAQGIAEGWRASVHRLLNDVSTSAERAKENDLLRVLHRAGPAGLTAREIGQRAHLSRLEVETLLSALEQDGLVERFQPDGRRAVLYREVGKA